MMRVAVLDDWQGAAESAADWSVLQSRAELVFFRLPFADADAAAAALADFDIVMAMRERTPFPASLVARLPRLKLFSLTGARAALIDMAALSRQGVTVCHTGGGDSGIATAELAFGLIIAAARQIAAGDASIRAGHFQEPVPVGFDLAGKTLGLVGLGRIGTRIAGYGRAFGMDIAAWSPHLTAERAAAGGARLLAKEALFRESHIVSLHLVLSDETRGIVGGSELGLMRRGAILVNTSRAGLVDRAALVAALAARRIVAALDVFDREPPAADDPIRQAQGTVLTPHLGYATAETYRDFYRQSVENVLAFLDGKPIRVLKAPAETNAGTGRGQG
jgi:phosphoglycerate dehydrogenase-like enzyme